MKGQRQARWFPPKSFYSDRLCKRCGVCCGSTDGHPCEHLRQDLSGKYFCEIYAERLGPHNTVDGHSFVCVEIRRVIEITGGYGECGYVEEIRRTREQMGEDASDLGRRKVP